MAERLLTPRVDALEEKEAIVTFFPANISSLTISVMFQLFRTLLIQRLATLLVKNRISRAAFIVERPSVSAAKRLPVQWL